MVEDFFLQRRRRSQISDALFIDSCGSRRRGTGSENLLAEGADVNGVNPGGQTFWLTLRKRSLGDHSTVERRFPVSIPLTV